MTNTVPKQAVVAEDPTVVDGHASGWAPYSTTDEDAWEWRITVDGTNVTEVNEKRTLPTAPLQFTEPYGEATVALVVHGMTRWLLGETGYEWCRAGADVRINKHSLADGSLIGNLGSYVVYDISTEGGAAGGSVVLLCSGALTGPAGVTHYKPPLAGNSAVDIGTAIDTALDFPSARHTFTTDTVGVTWDDPTAEFGAAPATVLNRVDRLLLDAYTSGRWTVARTSTAADYELVLKDTTTVDATITLGAPGVRENLRQNLAESPNVIFAAYDTTDIATDSALRTAPLAYDEKCDPYLYNATTGAVTGANPDYDATAPRVERFINVGNFYSRTKAAALAARLIFDPDDLPWYGTIELSLGVPSGDYGGTGAAAGTLGPLDFREGMNVRVRGLPGNPLLHVSGVALDLERWTAILTVDEAARDWSEVQAIIGRDKDAALTKTDPTRSYDGYYYGGGDYYNGGYGGGSGGYSGPPPFTESATEPTYLPPGWGWLDTS